MLYYAARRHFDQSRRGAIKKWLAMSRRKYPAVYKTMYGQFTTKELIAQVREMIDWDFEILMVHSSYEQLLPMYSGNIQELLAELMAFCGPNRTFAMPAFILGAPEYDPIKYYRRVGKFDVRRSISEMGLMTESFRRKPGVRRSLHPTHSICALGPLAEELTAKHHLAVTQKGKNSPFEFMAKRKTAILGIGVEYYRSLTQLKSVEDLLEDDFPIPSKKEIVDVKMIDDRGLASTYKLTVKTYANEFRGTVVRSLLSPQELIDKKFHGVPLWSTSAQVVTESLLEAASKGITSYGTVHIGEHKAPSRLTLMGDSN